MPTMPPNKAIELVIDLSYLKNIYVNGNFVRLVDENNIKYIWKKIPKYLIGYCYYSYFNTEI